jgi:diaminohydroxyphosphoribosylaminopyrimidine deaminase/5-amino-6-(5-phosphoribosylamino)uracil reductase
MTHDDDIRFMTLALALGRRGLGRTWPNPAVGAVIVRHEAGGAVIVGRGWTQPGGRPHAEIEALARAGEAARGATAYVTLEPCSHHGKSAPCADALVAAGVAHVVSALEDPNPLVAGQGHRRLEAAGIAVRVGPLAEEARRAHAGHLRRLRDGRPHITLKLAISADGKAGLAGRRPVAITGPAARERVHLMRAMYDAVLTGIGTIMADDPLLTCRLPGMAERSPVRVVLDSRLKLALAAQIAVTARQTPLWVITTELAERDREQALRGQGIEVLRVPARDDKVDLALAMRCVAERGITRVMAETGPILATSLLHADLVDEVVLLRSAMIIGPDGIDALEGLPLEALTRSPKLKIIGTEEVGTDTMHILARH